MKTPDNALAKGLFQQAIDCASQPGVNRLYLPVSRRATSLFLLHRQRRAGGQGPSALTEIPATAGFHHEGAIGAATADPRRCMSSVIVDIQKQFGRWAKPT
jgi:hypothetical protein